MKKFCAILSLLLCGLFVQTAAAQQEAKPIRTVTAGLLCGKATSLPRPAYPKKAKKAGISGTVKVRVIVGTDGKVETAEALEGPELLRKSAEQAALAASFAPTILSDEAVKVKGVIVYNFVK